jgi:hypothetical protein
LTFTDQAAEAPTPEEQRLALSAREIARAQLAVRERDLKACRSSENALRNPQVLGFEVNQGLPDYELVAGKDTLFRVFLAVPPDVLAPPQLAATAQVITDEPLFRISTLDYASLSVTGPDGVTFEVPGDLGDGEITNFSQSYNEHANANFYVDGASLDKPGRYEAVARFYRDGNLVGRVSLGRHTFLATKDLRLLIVVDTWPMPVSAWNILFGALKHVHRAFPVRAGIGPLNGDLRHGLRYEIDPNPFDPDFPAWGPLRQRFDQFNAAQQAQGHPDRVEHILSTRTQQPGEPPRGGVGAAGPGASVAGVVLNLHPPGHRTFATLISQELGHNFLGPAHTPDPEILTQAAFDLVGRRSIFHPQSIMYGFYSGTPSEDGLFLPKDWSVIRRGLLATTSTGNA